MKPGDTCITIKEYESGDIEVKKPEPPAEPERPAEPQNTTTQHENKRHTDNSRRTIPLRRIIFRRPSTPGTVAHTATR